MNDRQYDPQLVQQFFQHDYHDRGMMKWQGFYLSDHTAALAKEAQQEAAIQNRQHSAQMNQAAISAVINSAITKQSQVAVEINERNSAGLIVAPVIGQIQGWVESALIINQQLIALETIYAIKVID